MVEEHLAAERAADGKLEALGEAAERGHRRLAPARAADDDEGALGGPEQLLELRHLGEAGMGLDLGTAATASATLGDLAKHVLGQRDDDRTLAPGGRLMEGAGDDLGDALGAVDLGRPFAHLAG